MEIFGRIGYDYWAEDGGENTAKRIAEKIAELKNCAKVEVRINSLGGDVDTALAVYAMLKECENVTTEAIGMVASAATVIFMAGRERKINKSALLLVHKCSSTVWGGNENALEEELEAQKTINDTMKDIYAEGGVSREKIEELMEANHGEGKWITASEAKDYGFATVVAEGSRKDAEARRLWSAEDLAEEGLPMTAGWLSRLRAMVASWMREENQHNNDMKENEQERTETAEEQAGAETEATAAETNAELEEAKAERDQLRARVAEQETENQQLRARVAELEAVVGQTPEGAEHANGDDPKTDSKETFGDWTKKQPYYAEVEAELAKRRIMNN